MKGNDEQETEWGRGSLLPRIYSRLLDDGASGKRERRCAVAARSGDEGALDTLGENGLRGVLGDRAIGDPDALSSSSRSGKAAG